MRVRCGDLHGGTESSPRERGGRGRVIPALALILSLLWFPFPTAGAEPAALRPVGPRPLDGWPVILGNGIFGAPAVADVDGDGRDEIAVGIRDGRVFLLDGTGRTLPGWPRSSDGPVLRSPIFCDLDGDGASEVIASSHGGTIHAWNAAGEPVPGWPVALGAEPATAPVAIPVDGANRVLQACADGSLRLLAADGTDVAGWPLSASAPLSTWYDASPATSTATDCPSSCTSRAARPS